MRFLATWLTPLVALLGYLFFWPTPIEPVAWQAPPAPGYVGAHAVNQGLSGLQTLPLPGDGHGPEAIEAWQGRLYTGLSSGDVVRVDAQGQASTVLNTGGRPLGLAITPAGQMYVADALKGLLHVNLLAPEPTAKALLTKVDWPATGDPIRYADAVAVDVRGHVWLTDASRRFSPAQYGGTFEASILDILEQSCTGRLLVMDPQTEVSRVALSGLCFPNGLVFSADTKSLFVSETGRFRILKVDLARLSTTRSTQGMSAVPSLKNAFDQGAVSVLIDNLPGYPDNLTRGAQGRLWVGLTKPRSPIADQAAGMPWLRAMMLRLPRALWPVPPAYGHLIAFDETGRIVADLQDPAGAYPETTAATELDGRLYVQSLNAPSLGWMPYPRTSP
jgi:sugar lactone lactonase YvrE